MQTLRSRIEGPRRRIGLPEATEPRVLRAAKRAGDEGLCTPVLVGCTTDVENAAREAGVEVEAHILDPTSDPDRERVEAALEERLERRGETRTDSDLHLSDPATYAGLALTAGVLDGMVMGAVATTAQTVRVALRTVGLKRGTSLLSSCFLMILPNGRRLIFSDGGVVPDPGPKQLAEIAVSAAASCRALLVEEPRVALLSFSTKGSAEHPRVEKVRRAVALLTQRGVDFDFDGELQADAALVEEIGRVKAPRSAVAGRANVLVFPDLDSGNIGYKLTERLGGAEAVGPLLQGTALPIHDLSRGCSSRDVADVMVVAALEAQNLRKESRSDA